MKKINKTPGPNPLTNYAAVNKAHEWEHFYDQTDDYKELKKLVFQDQGGLCAYCEAKPKTSEPSTQRLEHFHSKSDRGDPNKNWALDWHNVIGVCHGGSDYASNAYKRPENLSCDAHKDYLINKRKLPIDCDGWLINPLSLPDVPCLFEFDLVTYQLKPNALLCQEFAFSTGSDTFTMVKNTIEYLNLNCDRLTEQRRLVLEDYNREKKLARANKTKPQAFHAWLANKWFQKRWLSFFTTRRILLGGAAEMVLSSQRF